MDPMHATPFEEALNAQMFMRKWRKQPDDIDRMSSIGFLRSPRPCGCLA